MTVFRDGKFCVPAALLMLSFPLPFFADTITFSARVMSGYTGKKNEYTVLEGNAEIKTSKIEISADRIELSGAEFRFVTASGTVKGKNLEEDMDFTCDLLRYDREQQTVTLQSNALISDNPNGVTAKAEMIQYNQRTGIALMQIDIELRQKDSVCSAAFAIYRKDKQILEMSGDPKIVRGSDVFRAREITLNLDTEEIRLDGRVRGTVTDTRESAPEPSPPGSSPTEPAAGETPAGGTPAADGGEMP
jgi:lipopolysaccharide export system protein LptA